MMDIGISFLVELIGTFVFLSVILLTGAAIPIAIALAAVIFLGGNVSGGNFNPAVSLALLMQGKMDISRFGSYVIAQAIGAALAVAFVGATTSGNKKSN